MLPSARCFPLRVSVGHKDKCFPKRPSIVFSLGFEELELSEWDSVTASTFSTLLPNDEQKTWGAIDRKKGWVRRRSFKTKNASSDSWMTSPKPKG